MKNDARLKPSTGAIKRWLDSQWYDITGAPQEQSLVRIICFFTVWPSLRPYWGLILVSYFGVSFWYLVLGFSSWVSSSGLILKSHFRRRCSTVFCRAFLVGEGFPFKLGEMRLEGSHFIRLQSKLSKKSESVWIVLRRGDCIHQVRMVSTHNVESTMWVPHIEPASKVSPCVGASWLLDLSKSACIINSRWWASLSSSIERQIQDHTFLYF